MSFDIPALIMGFREGLEAFLVIALILGYLKQLQKDHLKIHSYIGSGIGIILSAVLGIGLYSLSEKIGGTSNVSKAWESGASFVALILITSFIIWMIKYGSKMTSQVKGQVDNNLSPLGILFVSFAMIAREGTEVAIFTFAGKYQLGSVMIGITAALVIAILIYKSLIRVPLDLIFKITLAYLILQAGFLLGYSIHEGLSALKGYGVIDPNSWILAKAFNVSDTVFNHKKGVLGLPLLVSFGWYSKPEWLQLIVHYGYVFLMFFYWRKSISTIAEDNTVPCQA